MKLWMGVMLVAIAVDLAGVPLREPWMEAIPYVCIVIGALLLHSYTEDLKKEVAK